MPATVYELVDVQQLFSQNIENVFHFVDPAGSTDVEGLVDNYVDDVLPLVVQLQTNQLSHVAIRYRQVYPAATLMLERALVPSVDGVETGDALATCDAMSGKWILGNPTVNLTGGSYPHIKRGGVRLGGPTEGNVIGNGVVAGYVTAWGTWVAELRNPGTGVFVLCVASFLGPGAPGARVRQHTATQYAVPTAGSAPSPSTQNSRKFLRGRSF